MDINEKKELWDSFLARWPKQKVNAMTLEQYVSVDDQDTFTYWLETKAGALGSIKGNTSAKFGIYKRKNSDKNTQNGIKNGKIYSWWERLGSNEASVFNQVKNSILEIIDAAFTGDLEKIDAIDFSPMVKWKIAFIYQNQQKPCVINIFSKEKLQILVNENGNSQQSFPELYRALIKEKGNQELLSFGAECWLKIKNKTLGTEDDDNEYSDAQDGIQQTIPLNQILFGPPGTGKTYHTIEAAVKAAEPTFTWTDRDELKAKYDALVNEKRIRFVTFHQSFGYEEFLEGIKPDVSDSDAICYSVESGIFKKICENASLSTLPANSLINKNGRVWKISIEGAHQNKTKEYCLKENLAVIGWYKTGDLSIEEKSVYFQGLGKNAQNSLLNFSQEMIEGDLVVCIDSATSIEAIGVVTGPYRHDPNGLAPIGRADYTHIRPVQWLQKGFSVDLKELNGNKQFSLPTCYQLFRLSVSDVLRHLEANNVLLPDIQQEVPKQNYVLVIDEINRGNISKIFGELITLIEPSKREGNEEALKLALPYSGKPFSVPNNLYIIGTMNTADRSLTMLDTALRRRFDFVEMMPDPAILENAAVKGIDLTQLLTTLNQRIEVLYDREHSLGHAFFIPVKDAIAESEDVAFQKLIGVFQNKIIPLLQEYFFEDWQKIRLVLGDNQKPKDLQFVTEEKLTNQSLDALFGTGHGLNQYGDEQCRYALQLFTHQIWQDPQAYSGIYSKVASQKSESEMNQMPEGADAS